MSEVMKERKEKLFSSAKNGYDRISEKDLAAMEAYCALYRDFIDLGKTERECALRTMQLAEERGFVAYRRGMKLQSGDKVYVSNRGKSVLLAVIGKKSLAEGAHIAAAHIDSPRLDLK